MGYKKIYVIETRMMKDQDIGVANRIDPFRGSADLPTGKKKESGTGKVLVKAGPGIEI